MTSAMKMFFDIEFTGLHQHTTPISIALVPENGGYFYAEFTDYDRSQCNEWINKNVIANLLYRDLLPTPGELHIDKDNTQYSYCGTKKQIVDALRKYLALFDSIEMWGDCLAYDWVLFCELFDALDYAERLPRNVYYIPFDICTMFKIVGIDPDTNRKEFAGAHGFKHNALDDAKTIKECFRVAYNGRIADAQMRRQWSW